jgi:hypothetical protein
MDERKILSDDYIEGMIHGIDDGPDSTGPYHHTLADGTIKLDGPVARQLLSELLHLRRELDIRNRMMQRA